MAIWVLIWDTATLKVSAALFISSPFPLVLLLFTIRMGDTSDSEIPSNSKSRRALCSPFKVLATVTPEVLVSRFLTGIDGYTDNDPNALEAEPLIGGLGAMSVRIPNALREAELIITRFITPSCFVLGTIGWRTSKHKRLKAVAEASIEAISRIQRQVRVLSPRERSHQRACQS